MVAPTINNLDIADLVQRDSINEQVIGGVKRFAQGLRVDGPVEVDYLEGLHLRTTHAAALFRDEDATIYGNLVCNASSMCSFYILKKILLAVLLCPRCLETLLTWMLT